MRWRSSVIAGWVLEVELSDLYPGRKGLDNALEAGRSDRATQIVAL
jgi:hypothetical protein